jgi:hypothetical protein
MVMRNGQDVGLKPWHLQTNLVIERIGYKRYTIRADLILQFERRMPQPGNMHKNKIIIREAEKDLLLSNFSPNKGFWQVLAQQKKPGNPDIFFAKISQKITKLVYPATADPPA